MSLLVQGIEILCAHSASTEKAGNLSKPTITEKYYDSEWPVAETWPLGP